MNTVRSASWWDRFWAWVIDVMLMNLLMYQFQPILKIEPSSSPGLGGLTVVLFFYWTILEGYRGQSIGKMLLNIVVVGPLGEPVGYRESAVESFGKAFLLPLDCLAGWLKLSGGGQRYFNMISHTRVVYENDVLNIL